MKNYLNKQIKHTKFTSCYLNCSRIKRNYTSQTIDEKAKQTQLQRKSENNFSTSYLYSLPRHAGADVVGPYNAVTRR